MLLWIKVSTKYVYLLKCSFSILPHFKNPTISKTAIPKELVTRHTSFSSPNKVSYNIRIWKMRIKKCRSHMAKHQTPFISWVKFLCNFDMGPASGCQFLIEVMPGLIVHTHKYIFPSLQPSTSSLGFSAQQGMTYIVL